MGTGCRELLLLLLPALAAALSSAAWNSLSCDTTCSTYNECAHSTPVLKDSAVQCGWTMQWC